MNGTGLNFADRLIAGLRLTNRIVGGLLGLLLAATVAFVIADVLMRRLSRSLGGSDELSGYAMAIMASWGAAVALTERAHVRIDLLRQGLAARGRALMDLIAMTALGGVALVVAYQAWPVLEKSLARGSRANTPLETPLWIPQGLWFAGWVWFALSAAVMLAAALLIAARADWPRLETAIGMAHEGDEALAEARSLAAGEAR